MVEMLLRANADLTLKSELGESVLSMCSSFPELRGILEKRERKR